MERGVGLKRAVDIGAGACTVQQHFAPLSILRFYDFILAAIDYITLRPVEKLPQHTPIQRRVKGKP
jgi:hypothetical protein